VDKVKKINFLTGLILGIGISASTVAFASDRVQAILFPSEVIFHIKGEAKEINVGGDDPVINYNNKTYIPLRLFSESMGAAVMYQAPSDASSNKSMIDIYSISENDFNLQDADGYVSLGHLESTFGGGRWGGVSGLISIKKDMTGKAIEITALNNNKKVLGTSGEIMIDGSSTLSIGDVRKFQVSIAENEKADSYQVKVKDMWALTNNPDLAVDGDAVIRFDRGNLDPDKKALVSFLYFKNPSRQNITITPLNIEFDIWRLDADNEQLLYKYQLPALQGLIPTKSWYEASLPAWNLRDKDGKPVKPGKYAAEIKFPDSIEYTVDGSNEVKKLTRLAEHDITRWEYDITQSDIDQILK
jgi:hypothetical protein